MLTAVLTQVRLPGTPEEETALDTEGPLKDLCSRMFLLGGYLSWGYVASCLHKKWHDVNYKRRSTKHDFKRKPNWSKQWRNRKAIHVITQKLNFSCLLDPKKENKCTDWPRKAYKRKEWIQGMSHSNDQTKLYREQCNLGLGQGKSLH